jgi:hypothetical protein
MAAASVPVLRNIGGALPNCINHGGCGMSRQILRIIVTVWNISGSGSRYHTFIIKSKVTEITYRLQTYKTYNV